MVIVSRVMVKVSFAPMNFIPNSFVRKVEYGADNAGKAHNAYG